MKIKIRTKFILIAVTIVSVVSITMGLVSYYAGRNFLAQRISAQLNSLAQARASHIQCFLKHTKESAHIIATSRVLREMLKDLNVNGSDKASIIRDMNKRLNRFLIESHISNVFIIGTNGRIVASTNPKYIGLDRSTDAYFTGGQQGVFIKDAYVSRPTGQEGLAVSAPISDYKTGKLLGVIVAYISVDVINSIFSDQTGLGETGEVYLLNKNGVMIARGRW